jgi:hypothetical protein
MSTYERDLYEQLLRSERYKKLLERYGDQDIPGMAGRGAPGGRFAPVAKRNAIAAGVPGTPSFRIKPRGIRSDATPEDWGVAPVKRRSADQRVESLTRRMWEQIQADPKMAAAILKTYQEDLWRAGTPISYDDLKKIAIELLTEAERQQRIKAKSYKTN